VPEVTLTMNLPSGAKWDFQRPSEANAVDRKFEGLSAATSRPHFFIWAGRGSSRVWRRLIDCREACSGRRQRGNRP